jgi:hypothetical protein
MRFLTTIVFAITFAVGAFAAPAAQPTGNVVTTGNGTAIGRLDNYVDTCEGPWVDHSIPHYIELRAKCKAHDGTWKDSFMDLNK